MQEKSFLKFLPVQNVSFDKGSSFRTVAERQNWEGKKRPGMRSLTLFSSSKKCQHKTIFFACIF